MRTQTVLIVFAFWAQKAILSDICEKLPGPIYSIVGCCNHPYIQQDEASLRCIMQIDYLQGPPLLTNCVSFLLLLKTILLGFFFNFQKVHTCAYEKQENHNQSILDFSMGYSKSRFLR